MAFSQFSVSTGSDFAFSQWASSRSESLNAEAAGVNIGLANPQMLKSITSAEKPSSGDSCQYVHLKQPGSEIHLQIVSTWASPGMTVKTVDCFEDRRLKPAGLYPAWFHARSMESIQHPSTQKGLPNLRHQPLARRTVGNSGQKRVGRVYCLRLQAKLLEDVGLQGQNEVLWEAQSSRGCEGMGNSQSQKAKELQ